MGRVKDQIMSLFKTKDYSKPEIVKTVHGGGKKKSEENIIKSIRKKEKRDITINIQKSDTWKIQLTIAISLISSKDVDGEHVRHSKSNNIEFMSYDNANEVINELFGSLL